MLDLDSLRWNKLRTAYGFANHTPKMLRNLEANPGKKTWEAVWSSLCHQGSVYSASIAAIPHVVEFAKRRPPDQRFEYWNFVGAVASGASLRPSEGDPDVTEAYFGALQQAEPEIRRALELKPPREETAYLLSALLAVKGARGEAQVIEHLSSEEVPGQCPGCSEYLLNPDAPRPGVGAQERGIARDLEGLGVASPPRDNGRPPGPRRPDPRALWKGVVPGLRPLVRHPARVFAAARPRYLSSTFTPFARSRAASRARRARVSARFAVDTQWR
jgi:hypothetical protein